MSPEEAAREMAKVAVGFKMLESGRVSMMIEAEAEAFLRWLD